MKCLVALLAVCAAIGFSEQQMTKEQMKEGLTKLANDCSAKEGGSAADVDEVIAHKLPTTEPGKCIHACIGETVGVMKNNKIDVEACVSMAKMMFGDDATKLQTTRDMATECAAVTDGNRCQAAFKMLQCTESAAKSRNIEPPF